MFLCMSSEVQDIHDAELQISIVEICALPGFVSVLEKPPAQHALAKRGIGFAGNGGSVLGAANWNRSFVACESSSPSH